MPPPTDGRAAVMLHQTRPAPVMVRGSGSWLWDREDRCYLDFVQGWAVNCLGHCPPELQRALAQQAALLFNPSPAYLNEPQIALCRALADTSGLAQVFLASSGAEANEGAVKLARKWGRLHRGGAFRIVTTEGSFHGRTLATMAASGKPGWDQLFPPAVEGFVKVPYGDLDAVARAIDDQTAAVMVEPIQGEGGVVVPPPGYLRQLRALTRQRGVLLILDEVQTGIGRTGSLFAWQQEPPERDEAGADRYAHVRPDVMTLGKGLGGGTPLAALVASQGASCFAPGEQGGTYSGTPLMAAVGLAVLEAVQAPGFLAQVTARGRFLQQGLQTLATRFGCPEIRGQGLLWALALPVACAEAVVTSARDDQALLLNAPRPNLLRFMPALTVTEAELTTMLDRLATVLTRVLAAPPVPGGQVAAT